MQSRIPGRLRIAAAACAALGLGLAAPAGADPIRAAYVREGIAFEPTDPRWDDAPETTLPLVAQLIVPPVGGGSVPQVAVRAMHDGASLAVRLVWKDASADREVGVSTFRDAAALGFPVAKGERIPSPFMGDAEQPVAIWQWTADLEAAARGGDAFDERYPHTQGVWYFPQDADVRRQVRSWRGAEPVMELVATGFGTLAPKPGGSVRASSARAEDAWSVVLTRALATGEANEPVFLPGETTHVIVAVWEGSQQDVNGRKSVTMAWTPFVLDPTEATHAER